MAHPMLNPDRRSPETAATAAVAVEAPAVPRRWLVAVAGAAAGMLALPLAGPAAALSTDDAGDAGTGAAEETSETVEEAVEGAESDGDGDGEDSESSPVDESSEATEQEAAAEPVSEPAQEAAAPVEESVDEAVRPVAKAVEDAREAAPVPEPVDEAVEEVEDSAPAQVSGDESADDGDGAPESSFGPVGPAESQTPTPVSDEPASPPITAGAEQLIASSDSSSSATHTEPPLENERPPEYASQELSERSPQAAGPATPAGQDTPAWLLATATGLLLLVGGGHVANVATQPRSPRSRTQPGS